MSKKLKYPRGFTLIELLVVVLIVGVLAGVALPQYQYAVAKSKFAKVKSNTQSLTNSVKRFLSDSGNMPEKLSDLDITIPGVDRYNTGKSVWLDNNETYYSIEPHSGYIYIRGGVKIKGVTVSIMYTLYKEKRPIGREITVETLNTEHLASKLAAKETNNNNPRLMSYYMMYPYK